jgi:N-acetylmuramoyl-L-alanine amidase
VDPGAQRGDAIEKDLMLIFARELRDVITRSGGFQVMLTRDADVFVPLETRPLLARDAGADVFLSLHADALPEGTARGAAVYTLGAGARAAAIQRLAAETERIAPGTGAPPGAPEADVALVLMDLVGRDTAARTERLSAHLVDAMRRNLGVMHKRPRLEADFAVLTAPDMPSVLIELGFLSSARDRANLQSPEWRARAARGILEGLRLWLAEDGNWRGRFLP